MAARAAGYHTEDHQMRKHLLGAASVLVLLTGTALAQNAGTGDNTAGGQPGAPAAMPMPTAPAPSAAATPAPAPTAAMPAPAADQGAAPAPPAAPAATANVAPAAPEPSPPTTTDTKAPSSGTAVSADDMIGRSVQGSDGKPLGKVKDAVVDAQSGKIQKLVIASGGFLGIGAKNVAVDFGQVEIRPEGGIVAKGLTQGDIDKMPKYDVASDTKPLDQPPPPATTTPAVPGVTGLGASGGGVGAGGATVPAPRSGGAASGSGQ
jgi:sporulation protein YlmC with PRC-barrel domain